MGKEVDNRVVEMQFNNQDFEDKAQTTIKTLGNLKKGLDLESSAQSLENLNQTGKRFSLAGISDGVANISSKFSVLGITGITVLQNITNSAIETGKAMIKALTLDPIMQGFNMYETKMNAIQTILTNTASKGTKLNDVTKALADLNQYANLTIYDFADMTKNVGTFTAAGLSLKDSVKDIKGIANLGAGSGSTPEQVSSAMYQLSQALASGKVQLQDWNSVVNAGMGGEMFQNALVKTAKSMGKVVDMSNGFRASLDVKKGNSWLTSDVLSKTLAKFADDPALLKSATQVRTFTQLWNVMKESVQSNWAISWEHIIGDSTEAPKLLTNISNAFNNIIQPADDARNAMLKFWHDNGGRDAMIKALSNAFNGLMSVIKPVKQAWADIFPPMTGQRLTEISKNLETLTSHLKIGATASKNLHDTFGGLFAVLDIGKQAIEAVAGGIAKLASNVFPSAGRSVLSFTGNIGRYLIAADKAVKSTGMFKDAINKVADFMKPVVDGVKTAIGEIEKAFDGFGHVDLSGLDSFSERVRARFQPLTVLGDLIGKAFSKIGAIIQKAAPFVYAVGSAIGRAIDDLKKRITDGLANFNFDGLSDLVNGGVFTGILITIQKFFKTLTTVTKDIKPITSAITGILDSVRGCLEAYQKKIKADTIFKIAAALGILAAGILVLSLIDSKKLSSALLAMSGLFVELFGSMGVFEKIMGSDGFKKVGKVSASMIAVSLAILILSDAMSKLAKLDWPGIAKGLTSVAVLSATLVGTAKLLSANEGSMIKGATGFVIFAAAIDVLTEAVRKLGSLDVASLAKGLIGVGVLCAELALFMKTTDLSGMGITKAAGLVLLAAAINVLADAVKKFGSLDTGTLLKGLAGVETVLVEVDLFVNTTGNAQHVISTAIGLTIMGAAMVIFAEAVKKMGSLSWDQIGKGLITMGNALATIAVAVNFMPKNMPVIGVGMVLLATSLVILSDALLKMGGMSWESIAKGLVTLAGSLTIIAVAMHFMTTALPGAAALLVVAAALAILAPVLKEMGKMTWEEIGKGLLTLAGVFAIFGVAGLVLAPVVPVLLGLAGAIALVGVGCAAVGAGLLLFSMGLTGLAAAGTAGAAAIAVLVTTLVGLIPTIAKGIGLGIIAIAQTLATGAPALITAVVTIVSAILTAIGVLVPQAVTLVVTLILTILQTLAKYTPQIVTAGLNIISGVLQGIANGIGGVVNAAVNVIVAFLGALGKELPRVVTAGFNMMIDFINGLADSIRVNTPRLVKAMGNLMEALLEASWDILTGSIGNFNKIGNDVMNSGFIRGIRSQFGNAWSSLQSFGGSCVKKLQDSLGGFWNAGVNCVQGFINGIKSKFEDAKDWAAQLGNNALTSIKNALGIKSPSRKFAEVGKYSVLGFSGALKQFAGLATTEAANLGTNAKNALSKAMANVADAVNGNIDTTPTIRPVLDLSDIEAGKTRLNTLFGQHSVLDVTGSLDRVSTIGQQMAGSVPVAQNGSGQTEGRVFQFTQNNYSPEALSRLEIYRQTKNQLSAAKGLVNA